MTALLAPLGAEPFGAIVEGAPGVRLRDRLRRGERPELVSFVEITARRIDQTTEQFEEPFGAAPIGGLIEGGPELLGATSVLFSDREWAGPPNDPGRPNQKARAVLIDAGDFTVRGPVYPEESRRAGTTFASVRFFDDERFFARFFSDHAIDGAECSFFVGEAGRGSDDTIRFFKTQLSGFSRNAEEVTLNLETGESFLDTPAQTARYAGSGGEGGDEPLKGRFIDLTFGDCFNVPATLENRGALIFRPHVADIDAHVAVRDSGVELPWDGRVLPSYAALEFDDETPPGFYTKGPESRIKLADEPQGVVTMDVRGSTLFTGYQDSTAAILRFILSGGGSFAPVINAGTFGVLDNDAIGLFLPGDQEVTKADVANALLAPYLAWIDTDVMGRIVVAQLKNPRDAIVVDALGENDILENWELTEMERPVRFRQDVSYRRNFRRMTEAELVEPSPTGLSQILYDALREEELFASAGNLALSRIYKTEEGAQLRGYFKTETSAKAAARRITDLFGQGLQLATIPVRFERALNLRRGDGVAVTHSDVTGGETKVLSIFGVSPGPSTGITELQGLMTL